MWRGRTCPSIWSCSESATQGPLTDGRSHVLDVSHTELHATPLRAKHCDRRRARNSWLLLDVTGSVPGGEVMRL
jgi:hypothetical protein